VPWLLDQIRQLQARVDQLQNDRQSMTLDRITGGMP
jgi:outer membrane murein-binding lipoprotein Lpp